MVVFLHEFLLLEVYVVHLIAMLSLENVLEDHAGDVTALLEESLLPFGILVERDLILMLVQVGRVFHR